MKENTLLRLALIASLLGLATLFFISGSLNMEQTPISIIDDGMKGTQVKIIGSVESVQQAGESQILVISQPSSITVFVSTSTTLEKGDMVEIIGRVDEYRENKEIIADRIRTIS